MAYLQGMDRAQVWLLPERIEDYVSEESPVRVIDAFVDGMSCGDGGADLPPMREMDEAGGRPGYSPQTFAKLLIWGYVNRVRSSRDLERASHLNLEVIWLLGKLHPDYSSICRFRAGNADRIKNSSRAEGLLVRDGGLAVPRHLELHRGCARLGPGLQTARARKAG